MLTWGQPTQTLSPPTPTLGPQFCDNLHGGLNKLAETLDVARIGPQHQVCVMAHFAARRWQVASWELATWGSAVGGWLPLIHRHHLPLTPASGFFWSISQAGSDSLLTSSTFLKLAQQRFQVGW